MSKSQNGSHNDLTKVETEKGGDDFIQVKKKSEKADQSKTANDKKNGEKKSKSRSRNNSIGEGKPSKPRSVFYFPIASHCIRKQCHMMHNYVSMKE